MIWLVGNRGMLGTEVEHLLSEKGRAFVATDREVDVTRQEAIDVFLASPRRPERIDWIINCSAFTAVDAAESQPDQAYGVNEAGVRHLAAAAHDLGAAILHVSTDYVFDGAKIGPYTEEDLPNPVGVYGRSKRAGEVALQGATSQYVIVRTSWLYGRHGKSFASTMLRLFRERAHVSVVDDQRGSPTYAADLASAILSIVEHPRREYGLYHFSNEGEANWYQFAVEIYRQATSRGLAPRGVSLVPISSAQYPAAARRPANSVLSKEKFKRTFGAGVRGWPEALCSFLDEAAQNPGVGYV